MGIRQLAVDQRPAPLRHLPGQGRQSHLGSIRRPVKHGLSEEAAPQHHPVQSPRQFIPPPTFQRMGVAHTEQAQVGRPHRGGDPGTRLSAPTLRTTVQHRGEGGVAGDAKTSLTQALGEAAGNADLFGENNAARVRRPPQRRFIVTKPGENAQGVGKKQPPGGKVAADGKQTAGLGQFRRGENKLIGKTVDRHDQRPTGENAHRLTGRNIRRGRRRKSTRRHASQYAPRRHR